MALLNVKHLSNFNPMGKTSKSFDGNLLLLIKIILFLRKYSKKLHSKTGKGPNDKRICFPISIVTEVTTRGQLLCWSWPITQKTYLYDKAAAILTQK